MPKSDSYAGIQEQLTELVQPDQPTSPRMAAYKSLALAQPKSDNQPGSGGN